jgi:SAM-dependent methyltransferase
MSLRSYFEQRARDGTWGSLYDGAPDARTYNFLSRRAAVLDLLAGDGCYRRILDVGCGTGDYAVVAVRHGGVYHGVDFAPAMVGAARARIDAAGAVGAVVVGSGGALPYADDAFDLALAIGYLAYLRDPRPALAEIRRVLRPGGVLIAQIAKPDLCGFVDRALLGRLRAALRRSRTSPAPLPEGWVNVKYRARAFDRLLASHGFERAARVFNHFHALPAALRHRWPGVYLGLSEAMTRSWPSLWRALAVNYIGKYRSAKAQ